MNHEQGRDLETLDLDAIRERLAHKHGEAYWETLEELANTGAFRTFLQKQFPQGGASHLGTMSRRRFLKLAAASLGLAGLTACVGQPVEKIIPYVVEPEQIVPGKPLFFATAHLLGGYAHGLLAESHMGRPTKVEGNPDHPASLGATDAFAQASVLTLYDPDRAQVVTSGNRIRTWDQFYADLAAVLSGQESSGGAGLRILTQSETSPTLGGQMDQVLDRFPNARWHQYEPVNWTNAYLGTQLAFGQPLESVYNFNQADVILSLDADFMNDFPGNLRYMHDYADRRMVTEEDPEMNRMYMVESTYTITGSMADHRWALQPEQIETFSRAVANRLGIDAAVDGPLPEGFEARIDALVRDLQANGGQSVVLAGMTQPPAVHALAAAMNERLGNIRRTVFYTDPVQLNPVNQTESLRELVEAMAAGTVDVLIILDGNPAYTAPADIDFAAALQNVGFSVHMSLYRDETSLHCTWHLPRTHYLEMWSDARSYEGTATIIQPLIQPLYSNRSPHELLAAIAGENERDPYEIVRQFWRARAPTDDFDGFWRQTLHDGIVPDSRFEPRTVALQPNLRLPARSELPDASSLVVTFRPDPALWDGRFAENAWLQELPRPFTKLTWDNAALISPETGRQLGVQTQDVIQLSYQDQLVRVPVWLLPGQPDGCITLHLGYGRSLVDVDGGGFDVYRLRPSNALWTNRAVEVQTTNETYELATTQQHHTVEGRDLVRAATLQAFMENPDFAHEHGAEEELPSLYPEYRYDDYAWGMSINMNTCTGCSACVIACQAENNVPVVGKEGVLRSREMHWLRIDDYFAGSEEDPEVYHQPMLCMHCEKAPCEVVCPVFATTHSSEGINEMTYNRCVGTRYCSNNCPYKVRRFNFFDYTPDVPVLNLLYNPDVTVRDRGVMEKCTYCIQRVNEARSEAQREGRPIRDGEIMTACQQACPAQAIVFGDINDPDSRVSALKAQPHDYGLLAEIGTQPRTTYLAKIWNPNPELEV